MSTRLALGGITAVLRQVLRNGVADLAAIVGAPVSVSAVAPDTINLQDAAAVPTLNLFLHRISPNAGWRNANLPSFGSDGAQAQSPPLALDLHYLLTAYGKTDLQAEILLGSGMQVLHERPWLTRDTIRDALAAVPLDHLPPETLDQADGIKISLEPMGTDDLSRLWSAMQAHYRPSAAYQVSVVLIEPARPVLRSAPPVLNRSLGVDASLVSPLPALSSIEPASAELGETVHLNGFHLNASAVPEFHHPLLAQPHRPPAEPGGTDRSLSVVLPAAGGADWPAGLWTVSVALDTPDGPRQTNSLPLLLVPRIDGVHVQSTTPNLTLTADLTPAVQSGQKWQLILGDLVASPATAGSAEFTFPKQESGLRLPVRARVDGVESRLVLDAARTVVVP